MKCIRCNTPAVRDDRCPCCGADFGAMKENMFYLTDLAASSRQYASLRTAAIVLLIANGFLVLIGLLSGGISFSLPLLLTAIGVLLLGTKSDPSQYLSEQASPAPGRLFTASVILNALSDALTEALCIAVCIGGRDVIERILSLLEEAYGQNLLDSYNETMKEVGMQITEEQFYLAVYIAAIIGMFLCGAALVLSGVEVIFLHSYRTSVKTNKVAFSVLGLFSAVLLIRCIASFVTAMGCSLVGLVLYGATGYFYLNAFLFVNHVKQGLSA